MVPPVDNTAQVGARGQVRPKRSSPAEDGIADVGQGAGRSPVLPVASKLDPKGPTTLSAPGRGPQVLAQSFNTESPHRGGGVEGRVGDADISEAVRLPVVKNQFPCSALHARHGSCAASRSVCHERHKAALVPGLLSKQVIHYAFHCIISGSQVLSIGKPELID